MTQFFAYTYFTFNLNNCLFYKPVDMESFMAFTAKHNQIGYRFSAEHLWVFSMVYIKIITRVTCLTPVISTFKSFASKGFPDRGLQVFLVGHFTPPIVCSLKGVSQAVRIPLFPLQSVG